MTRKLCLTVALSVLGVGSSLFGMQKKKQLSEPQQILRDKQKAAISEQVGGVKSPVSPSGQENIKPQEKIRRRKRSPLVEQESTFIPLARLVPVAPTPAYEEFMKYANVPGGIELSLERLCLKEPNNIEVMRAQLQEEYIEDPRSMDDPAAMNNEELVKEVLNRSSVADMASNNFLSCNAVFDLFNRLRNAELLEIRQMLLQEKSTSAPGKVWEYITNLLGDSNAIVQAALMNRVNTLISHADGDVTPELTSVAFGVIPESERPSSALSEGYTSMAELEIVPLKVERFLKQVEKDIVMWDEIKGSPDAAQMAAQLMEDIATAFKRVKTSPASPDLE